eukprot:TRINITY_DN558_c1_g1_i3.p1 TRINITY_DN558_c1_g1~~TRINITY_DN558_c1_g1_i3.p1  ORF type:complete len:353 (+),score=56.25 TRINITY_DN558_c1_g1_i3:321-1379(+)
MKGLDNVNATTFPGNPHGCCLLHLERNLLSKFNANRSLLDAFRSAALARSERTYEQHLQTIKAKNKKMEKYLRDCEETWASVKFAGLRERISSTNISESFNSWILDERRLPIVRLLDQMRSRFMEVWDRRRTAASKAVGHGKKRVPCQRPLKHLRDLTNHARKLKVVAAHKKKGIFEVSIEGGTVKVILKDGKSECTCSGASPCIHMVAACLCSDCSPVNLIPDHQCEAQQQLIDDGCLPYVCCEDLEDNGMKPPIQRRQRGRPRGRIASKGEKQKKQEEKKKKKKKKKEEEKKKQKKNEKKKPSKSKKPSKLKKATPKRKSKPSKSKKATPKKEKSKKRSSEKKTLKKRKL